MSMSLKDMIAALDALVNPPQPEPERKLGMTVAELITLLQRIPDQDAQIRMGKWHANTSHLYFLSELKKVVHCEEVNDGPEVVLVFKEEEKTR